MGFSRQEYWSALLFSSPGDLSDPGIELASLTSPALAGGFFTAVTTWEAQISVASSNYSFMSHLVPSPLQKINAKSHSTIGVLPHDWVRKSSNSTRISTLKNTSPRLLKPQQSHTHFTDMPTSGMLLVPGQPPHSPSESLARLFQATVSMSALCC